MSAVADTDTQRCHRLDRDDSTLEVEVGRDGWRTVVALRRDGEEVARRSGTFRVLMPVEPEPEAGAADRLPHVLVLSAVPGAATRVLLLVPKPDGESTEDSESGQAVDDKGVGELPKGLQHLARADRYPFEPPPGSFAARSREFQRKHPGLYASRHVALAVGKVLLAVLGVALFFQVLVRRVVEWVAGFLPSIDLPWPEIDLPDIPWPHIPLPDFELPDVTLPPWLLAIAATAKFWVPVLVAIGIAVRETRKRRGKTAEKAVQSGAHKDEDSRDSEKDGPRDAHA